MSEICTTCGLPKELCVCQDIAKESQKIIVKIEKRKFGKKYTILQGLDTKDINIKDLAKKLKSKFACGGAAKNNMIELQGDHRSKAREALVDFGFPGEMIEIKK